MPSVGPQLPPHLAKRKRSIDDAEGPNSPPHKVQAAAPPIVLEKPPPPSKNPDELDIGDSSDDDYGPSPNPSNAKHKPKPSPPKRVLGPAPPPAPLSQLPAQRHDSSDSGSDSDDYGPAPPPPPGSAAAAAAHLQHQREQERAAAAPPSPTKPQRAEWMLAPPSDSDWTSRVDPTRLKNRKFASGKGAKAPAEKSGVSAMWTETPEEKRRRLEDEVLGRREAGGFGVRVWAGWWSGARQG